MIQERDGQLAETLKTKNKILQDREDEIRQLREKIKDMSARFAEMLKNTLDQMSQKIELVNQNFEEEVEPTMVKKLEDFTKIPAL